MADRDPINSYEDQRLQDRSDQGHSTTSKVHFMVQTLNGSSTHPIYIFPEPQSVSITYQDIDNNATRDKTTGKMIRDRIASKRTIQVSYPPMGQFQTSVLLKKVRRVGCSDPNLWIYFTNPYSNSRDHMYCYVAQVDVPVISYRRGQYNDPKNSEGDWNGTDRILYGPITLTFVEV